jgi:hypothetical protein
MNFDPIFKALEELERQFKASSNGWNHAVTKPMWQATCDCRNEMLKVRDGYVEKMRREIFDLIEEMNETCDGNLRDSKRDRRALYALRERILKAATKKGDSV